MGSYEEAWDEFENYRDNDFWYRCLTHCNMDEDAAKSMYIRLAAEDYEKEEQKKLDARLEEEEVRLAKFNIEMEQELKDLQAFHQNDSATLPFVTPWIGAVIGGVLSYLLVARGILVSQDGFFTAIWGWVLVLLNFSSSLLLGASICIWLRILCVKRYKNYEDKKVGFSVVFGVPALLIIMLWVIF